MVSVQFMFGHRVMVDITGTRALVMAMQIAFIL